MLAILAPVLVFGLVIFVHEFGHFLAAKLTGVYAPRFSIGFGPALLRHRYGETEYVLAALPLGGYVRMASRHDEETAFIEGGSEEQTARSSNDPGYDPEAMIPFGPKAVPEHRWFESKPLIARLFIMVAGVTMNVVLAVIVMSVLAFHYGRSIYPSTVIGAIHPVAGVRGLEGLQVGDTLRRVNGRVISNWNEVRERILASRDSVVFQTNRGSTTVRVAASEGDTASEAVANALVYYIPPVIDSIVPNDRAANAGFERGDSITEVGGRPVRSWSDMVNVVAASADKPVDFQFYRKGAGVRRLTVVPRAARDTDPATGQPRVVGKIGAAAKELTQNIGLTPIQAVWSGTRATWGIAASIVGFLHDLVVGQVSIKNLGGPVTIARASVSAARNGIEELFYLIALLSVNVAILNLLPIPILDGGQIVINVLESAKGSPFSLRTREYILRFGLIAIALLFAVVMYNDTRGGLAKLFGWVAHLFG